jgi:iron(III) transport system substrate-binding protein
MANPLFGTTATHVAALFAYLGKTRAEAYFRDLKENQIRVVDGNSVVKDQVGAGELAFGMTDTDDVNTGILAGMPIEAVYPDQTGMGTLLIPNTVALISGAPHPEAAKRLIDYLLSREVEEKLAFSPSVQMPLKKRVSTPPHVKRVEDIVAMPVDYEKVADGLSPSVRFVQRLFIR